MLETTNRKPTHPGLLFKRQVLDRLSLTITQAAQYMGISRTTLSKFCNGSTPCTIDLAKRIAYVIDSNVGVWINLQANYDAWIAQNSEKPDEMTKFPVEDAA